MRTITFKSSVLATAIILLVVALLGGSAVAQSEFPDIKLPLFKKAEKIPANFRRENLVAWCIVPFDNQNRSPEDRATMLVDLGLKRCAYDWRKKHVPEFEREILAYQKNEIEFSAFWSQHDDAFGLFEKHKIQPQVWTMMKPPSAESQDEKIAEAIAAIKPLAKRCKEMGCRLGLYNHGGWQGEPDNMIAICEGLRAAGFANSGIVYNFHHAHDQILDAKKFTDSLARLKPYLLCLNLNGMVDLTPYKAPKNRELKIQPIGRGDFEVAMIKAVIDSGYEGPIGVLGHVNTRDVKEVLRENLEGLEYILGARSKPDWLAKADEADYMAKWTPKARANSKFPYESEKDPDWVDERPQFMNYGLTFNHSINVPIEVRDLTGAVTKRTKKFPKAIASQVSEYWLSADERPGVQNKAGEAETRFPLPKETTNLLFDTEQLNFVAHWAGDFITVPSARFGILKMPSVAEDPFWAETRDMRWQIMSDETEKFAPASDGDCRFDGYHLPMNKAIVYEYTIGRTKLIHAGLASQHQGDSSRSIRICRGPSADHLRLPLCSVAEVIETRAEKDGVESELVLKDARGKKLIAISSLKLTVEGSVLLADFPPSKKEVNASVLLYSSDEDYGGSLAESYSKFGPEFSSLRDELNVYPTRRWGPPLKPEMPKNIAPTSDVESAFKIDTIPVPLENEFKALMFTSGFDFLDKDRAYVCTVHGDVWLVSGLAGDLSDVTWQRSATGLYQPLGLKVVDGKPIVMCRDRLTRLHDRNGDGEADFYENFNDDLVVNGQPHAYAMSLEADPEGNFYFIKSGGSPPHGGTMLKLTADGKDLSVHATGYRHANGMGVSPTGVVTSADNEGNWIPATRIDWVQPGGFYGHMPTHRRQVAPETYDPPLLWMPRSIDNSAGGQTWVPKESKSWAPLAGKMIHFSFGRCTANVVLPQKVGDVHQAAIYKLDIPQFKSGSMRGRFSPFDGHLYVCGLDGWQTAAVQDGHFQRVRATGKPFYQPVDFQVYRDRIEISFDQPLDPALTQSAKRWSAQQWNYRWTAKYGSDHYSVEDPEKIGHDDVAISKVELSEDRKKVRLFIDGLKPVMQMVIRADLRAADGHESKLEVFNTIHALK